MLRFDGRVAVVTGAGAGLGRAYALLLASRGASVVVNDLGGSRSGDGKSTNAADTVVAEIRAKGGKAVPDYNSVEDGEKIIQTAVENFGRVDIVINNAGILRDKSFARISDGDWDIIQRVHLKGSFKTTQAAWPHFRKQKYGKVVMTASNSGIFGNFGQANYSAAKMGLIGLSNTVSIEGAKYGIHSNVIVPTAGSRLTEDIMPPDLHAELKPELIAPVVAWLCHESCEDNGSVVESAGGWAGKLRWEHSKGAVLRKSITDAVTLEDVRDKWGQVVDMSAANHHENMQESMGHLSQKLETLRDPSSTSGSPAKREVENSFTYAERDVILYALGVGAGVTEEENLKFLYEGHEEFCTLPTFGVLPGQMTVMSSDVMDGVIPGRDIDPTKILHGEQYLEVLKPIPTSGTLISKCSVSDVLDKGSGAVIIVEMNSYTPDGEKIIAGQMVVFVVGAGGFGGKRTSTVSVPSLKAPERRPDAFVEERTSKDQAALYRLSGDTNPLHIDPSFALVGGFDTPILHGLCSLGYSARHVLQRYANNDVSKFKSIKCRFAKPVLPGQTLRTDMWREGSRIHFETKVAENGNVVITGAYIDLNISADVQPLRGPSDASSSLRSAVVFAEIERRLKANPGALKGAKGVLTWIITKEKKPAGKWTLNLATGELKTGDPVSGKADTTLTLEDEDMVAVAAGQLNPQQAFMKGKLKITGNIMLTQKLQSIFKEQAKL